ncbi:hypothetical protein, partial [Vibrio cidicii]|uniref:hypothetical protein n=1 Tax=Vibrio cidicii TaxID=1763883 RepID=UPI001A2B1D72
MTQKHFKITLPRRKKERKKEKLRHKYKTIESINEWKKYILKLATYPVKKLHFQTYKKIAPDVIASHNMYYFL